jgi:5-formyltetrahydrofolate cyclo-ligase
VIRRGPAHAASPNLLQEDLFLNLAYEIKLQKNNLRSAARRRRKDLAEKNGKYIGCKLVEIFCKDFPAGVDKIVAGYLPIGSEADVKPLLTKLCQLGCTCLLPVVTDVDEKLTFRKWQPGDSLVLSNLGISEPVACQPAGDPNTLLVPLLAFDMQGYRLGYGGGYYDRTLKMLRSKARDSNQKLLVIGVCFAGQRVESVPHDEFDQRIDFVITEEGLYKF